MNLRPVAGYVVAIDHDKSRRLCHILYQLSQFEALAIIVFEIPRFLCPNFQRGITKKKLKFSPGNLLIILYLLAKFEAPSSYTF